jgi:RNA polymerase sigma factor (sigma-70 family)
MSDSPSPASLEILVEKLQEGDVTAAERVFKVYEPYLRLLVRRQLPANLRAKLDSVDIVQSVWVDVVAGLQKGVWEFVDAARLRAFLIKVTRNRLIDRNRTLGNRPEQLLGSAQDQALPPAHEASPSENVQAEDLWEQMLSLCPPAHRPILLLKRQGCDLAEIAKQTGFHPSSVRRILYDLARRLAVR